MSRQALAPSRKREFILEQLELYRRAGFRVVTSRQILGRLEISVETINAFGRKEFTKGQRVELDGDPVLVTYSRRGWSMSNRTADARSPQPEGAQLGREAPAASEVDPA